MCLQINAFSFHLSTYRGYSLSIITIVNKATLNENVAYCASAASSEHLIIIVIISLNMWKPVILSYPATMKTFTVLQ